MTIGIVKFGSGHSSIVLEASLKTEASITDISGASLLGTGHLFDSSKGMLAGLSGSVYLGELTDYQKVGESGQWSIDVESEWLAYSLVTDQGKGYSSGINEYLLSHGATNSTITTPFGHYRATPAGELSVVPDETTAQVATRVTTLSNTNAFTTLTFGNRGAFVDMYIDGRFIHTRSRHLTTDLFRHVWLNCLRGLTTGGLGSHYMKNLVISNEPVILGQKTRIGWLGDSFVIQATPESIDASLAAPGYDGKAGMALNGFFEKHNVRNYQGFHGTSGGQVSQAAGTSIVAKRPELLAQGYEHVVYHGGVNDANTGTLPADFETSIQDDVDTILASGTGVKDITIVTIPSVYPVTGTQANAGVVDQINAIYAGLPAVWDAANPTDTGRVLIADMFAATGGHDPISRYFVAMDNGLLNESHYTAAGQKLLGEKVGTAIISGNYGT